MFQLVATIPTGARFFLHRYLLIQTFSPLSAFNQASPVSGEANARSLPGCELPVSGFGVTCHMQRQAHLLLQILGHKLIRMALQGL